MSLWSGCAMKNVTKWSTSRSFEFGRRPLKYGRLHSSMTLRVISIMFFSLRFVFWFLDFSNICSNNLWVEREILEKKQFIRCLRMSSHVNLPWTLYPTKVRLKLMGIQKSRKEEEESQDLLRFETQDLDDQVLRAHIQNGYIYLQMSKHGVAPFRVRWKVLFFPSSPPLCSSHLFVHSFYFKTLRAS
ncbi:hypothetical protein AMTRI_Chr02g253760 [Amborella trichopoda]